MGSGRAHRAHRTEQRLSYVPSSHPPNLCQSPCRPDRPAGGPALRRRARPRCRRARSALLQGL